MSKGLEALERIQCNYVHVFKARENGKTQLVHDLNTIKKELKAFEIIKDLCNLKVYKNKLGQCFIEGTNILFPISQAKYDVLKRCCYDIRND